MAAALMATLMAAPPVSLVGFTAKNAAQKLPVRNRIQPDFFASYSQYATCLGDTRIESKNRKATKEPKAKTANGKRPAAPKVEKPEAEVETSDRLPSSIEELKASKGGLVTFLFLSGRDKEGIAKELKDAFKVSDEQAVKITRRITGRARFFQRALQLTAAK
jgi:hypothetical protein